MTNFKINVFKKGVAKKLREDMEIENLNEISKENTELLLIESILGNKGEYSFEDIEDIKFIFSKVNNRELFSFFKAEKNFDTTIDKYPFLAENFKNEKFNISVANNLLKFPEGKKHLFDYLDNLLKSGNAPTETSDIKIFLHNLTEETFQHLIKQNPLTKDYFDKMYVNSTQNQTNNILQEVAIYNPKIYKLTKSLYPELSLYDNHRDNFIFSIREEGKEIFKEEIFKQNSKYIFDYTLNQGNYFQQEIVFNDIVDRQKKFINMKQDEALYALSFLMRTFQSVWKNKEKEKHKEIYKEILQNTNNINFIEHSLYFTLSFAGVLNFEADMNIRNTEMVYQITDEILSCIEVNPNIKGVKILNIFEKQEFPEFWLNSNGLAERFLKSPKTTFFSSPQETEIFKDNEYMEKVRDFFFQVAKMMEVKGFKPQVTETWGTMSMVFNKMETWGKTLTIEKSSDMPTLFLSENNSTHKKIGTLSTFHEIAPFINSLSRKSCINILSSILPTTVIPFTKGEGQATALTKNTVLNKLLEKVQGENFSNITKEIAEKNIFTMCSIYSDEELFDNGKIKEIFNMYPYDINELFNKEESLLFLFKHLDRDLTEYGINRENPLLPKCLAENIHSPRVLAFKDDVHKFSKIYNNSSFREKNGDNILHNLISNSENELTSEIFNTIASAFPELVNEANKKKKYPIDLLVSKLKKTKNQSKNNNNVQMIKTICNLEFSPPVDKVLSLYNDLQLLNEKVVIMFPAWESYIQKRISLNIMNKDSLNCQENDLEYKDNNEWKI